MSTKPRDGTTTDELTCGRIGCGDAALVIIDHPAHGYRAVCEKHTFNQWVVDYV